MSESIELLAQLIGEMPDTDSKTAAVALVNMLRSVNDHDATDEKAWDTLIADIKNGDLLEPEPERLAFVNISERYGNPFIVMLRDYEFMLPSGEFIETSDGIYEKRNGQLEQIARPIKPGLD